VIGVLGGLTAAFMWGSSTVVASRTTRMLGSQQALAYVMTFGFCLSLVLAPAIDGRPHLTARGMAWAVAAGCGSVGGLSTLYRALRIGKVGVVAPIASTEGALAALFSVGLGERLSFELTVALAVVAAGVVLVTFHGRLADLHVRPALMALAAAALFGISLVASARSGEALGPFWTILVGRSVGVVMIAVPLVLRGALSGPGRALPLVLWSGLAEVFGYAAFILGSRRGVAVPAVMASQFAAVAAIGSYFAFGERLTRRQVAGALVIGAGVAMVAVIRA
jgi:drug/metabolite transporter (DMT)-like permease